MAAYLVANSYLGLLPAGGTPVYIPVTSPQVTPNQTFLRDEALRGSPVMVYDEVQGVRHDEYDAKFYLFADTFPNFIKSVLGVDAVTGSTAPYTHTMTLLNQNSNGSQPGSYTLMDFDGANYFTLTNAVADQVDITFGAEAAVESTVKFMANPYTASTTVPSGFTTPTISTTHMIPAWDTKVKVGPLGGTQTQLNYIQDGTLTIARKTAPIFTMGTQAPYQNFAGPIEVTGKFTAVVDSQQDPWSVGASGTGSNATALTYVADTLQITFTDPNDTAGGATPDSVSFLMTNVQFMNVKRTRGKSYTEVEVEFTARANPTDSTGGTSYSPLQAIVVNSQSTPY
jgi:hypothetical protein